MGYAANMIANNILMRSFRDKHYISPMKLQKMLYFAVSEYAKRTGGGRLIDEPFCTWKYGPVLRSVYDEFSCYGADEIKSYAKDAKGVDTGIDETTDPLLGAVLDDVWSRTRHVSAWDLSVLTHQEGSAWDKANTARSPYLVARDVWEDTTYQKPLYFVSMEG